MSLTAYERVTATIQEALERGTIPWRKPWNAASALPMNAVSKRPYRGINVFLLGITQYTDHRWLTFQQATHLGGKVRKGEKASLAIFWKCSEIRDVDEGTGEVTMKTLPLLRYYSVFNVEQCQDLMLPALEVTEPKENLERIERADLLVRSMPNPPTIREGGREAWYRPADDLVQVPKLSYFDSADHFYATLYHELGHATGIESRLNRSGVTGNIQFGSMSYSHEELVAELTSAFCCAVTGLDNSVLDNAASYIKGWLTVFRENPKTLIIAAAQAQRAADYIRGIS